MSEESTKMVLPCTCPHCDKPIVIDLDVPHPTIDVMMPEEVPEEIQNIIENQNDSIDKFET